jgi:hypothetical protein
MTDGNFIFTTPIKRWSNCAFFAHIEAPRFWNLCRGEASALLPVAEAVATSADASPLPLRIKY